MRYVFGPVPSRRLGRSLGVDPIPFKTCNWNCVYCQLGYTAPLTGERKDYYPPGEIVAETLQAVTEHELDWITFVGSGEPSLHKSLGWMLRRIKAATDIPVAVITNGSLLYLPEVREELSVADAVLPSLDAGSEALYLRIDRPQPPFTFQRLVDGLVSFRDEYRGKLWVEVMLIKGMNDTLPALHDLAAVLRRVRPDQVHINEPVRPPAVSTVEPAGPAGVMRAARILGDVARIVRPTSATYDLAEREDLVEAVIEVIGRHPMSQAELEGVLAGRSTEEAARVRACLAADRRARLVRSHWCLAEGGYVEDKKGSRV
ncbi:MAG: radical SAM protein [Deltaproteobacteria bacterium]|nr:radical SAM protein [Deltaproteobacteria bacterium]